MMQSKIRRRYENTPGWLKFLLLFVAALIVPVGLTWCLGLVVSSQSNDVRMQTVSILFGAVIQYLSAALVVGTLFYAASSYRRDERRHQERRYDALMTGLFSEHLATRLVHIDSLSDWINDNPSYWSKTDRQLVRLIGYRASQGGFVRNGKQTPQHDAVIAPDIAAALVLLGKRRNRPYMEARRIDLSRLCFPEIKLTNVDLRNIKLSGANFDGATFVDVRLDDVLLVGTSFRQLQASNTSFRRATAWGADFSNATFYAPEWEGLKCDGAMWAGAEVGGEAVDLARLRPILDLSPRTDSMIHIS